MVNLVVIGADCVESSEKHEASLVGRWEHTASCRLLMCLTYMKEGR